MDKYPSPCNKCPQKDRCKHYKKCQPWLARYLYRQKQINAFAKKVLPGLCDTEEKEQEQPKNQSPCLTCTRVKDPENCGNVNCKLWREWFIGKWDKINGYSEKHLPDHEERMKKGIYYDDED